jgi:hypothetical protein
MARPVGVARFARSGAAHRDGIGRLGKCGDRQGASSEKPRAARSPRVEARRHRGSGRRRLGEASDDRSVPAAAARGGAGAAPAGRSEVVERSDSPAPLDTAGAGCIAKAHRREAEGRAVVARRTQDGARRRTGRPAPNERREGTSWRRKPYERAGGTEAPSSRPACRRHAWRRSR